MTDTTNTKARHKKTAASKAFNLIAKWVCIAVVFLIIAILAFTVGYILVKGIPHLSWDFLTSDPESFLPGGGIGPNIFNSFYILVITLIISIPISIGASIYLSEYAPKNFVTHIIKVVIEALSSLPSIVVGLFGYLLFVIQFDWGFSILSGAIALMIFNLPLMVRSIQQSLEAIPQHMRDAGLAMGLTRWETTIYILIPSAMPGIITGLILSSGRIFGEAAALLYTSGQSAPSLDFSNFDLTSPNCPWNIMRPAETLAVHIWKINSEGVVPDVEVVSTGTAAFLMIFVLIFNLSARFVGTKLEKKLSGEG